jgi:DNA-binding FadR family transcriptional regulator
METASPAVKMACNFLENAIADGTFCPGKYLPPLGQLARSAGVGSVTMWKALQHLRANGVVAGVKGHPFIVLPASGTPAPRFTARDGPAPHACVSRSKSQRVADRIEKDILGAIFPPGAMLPSIKELKSRYGCSYPTIRRTLDSLHDRSIIASVLRGYKVAKVRPPAAHTRIVFIGYSWEHGDIILSPIEEDFLHMLELACVNGNIRLDVVYFSFENDVCVFRDAATGRRYELSDTEDVLGYAYILTGEGSFREEVLSILYGGTKPLAIIDEIGVSAIAPLSRHSRPIKLLRIGTTNRAPLLVGRFLRIMGHSKIAYISPFHRTWWSKLRLETLARMLAGEGADGDVVSFTLDEFAAPIDFLPFARRRCDTTPLTSYCESLRARLPAPFLQPIDWVKFEDTLEHILANCEVSLRCEKLFTRALSTPGITAWVCANDSIAVLAQKFLKRKNIEIPRDVSLIGFDDTYEAMKLGLTSYNFNFQSVVNQVLDFIVRRGRSGKPKQMIVEIEGFLSQRQSTWPAKKARRD